LKNFAVYKSSAGSGKTTTLAIEFLKISLQNPDNFKHILALTFTKDAANEMKQRILDYLVLIINYREGNQLDFIFDHLIESANKLNNTDRIKAISQLKEKALVVLQLILHNYSDFSISTIDSFTHRVIKSFAHDLGIAISFEVELDSQNLLKDAVNELISGIGEDNPKLTEVLMEFSMHKIGTDKSRKIDSDLQQLAKDLLEDIKEEFLVGLRQLSIDELLEMKKLVFEEIKAFDQFLIEEAGKAKKIILDNGLNCKTFYYGIGNICNWFFKLSDPNFDESVIKPKPRVFDSINHDKWTSSKASAGEISKIETIKPDLIHSFNILNNYIEENYKTYILYKQISKNIYPLLVLIEIEKLIFRLKSENNLLHISDFNKLIANAIADEPAPFIYERIGNWYKYFLLDEFQDTSGLQWNNILPLVENGLSEGKFSLVVGDGKQSIYRFRGGDVNQFADLPMLLNKPNELAVQREQILINNFEEKRLLTNFRSDEHIVRFNNELFKYIADSDWLPTVFKKVYTEVEQVFAPGNEGFGLIDIHLNDQKDEEALNRNLLIAINKALSEGYSYADITLLVRKNKEASTFADLLIENNIPVISSVALRVASSAKVKFLISFFNAVLQPKELLFKVEMIRYLLQNHLLGEKTMLDFSELLLKLIDNGFQNAFTDLLKKNGFSLDENEINQSDVYELAEYLIRTFKLRMPDPYLQFFLDNLIDFKKKQFGQLNDFMLWWEENYADLFIELPTGLNAVTIQTVFKAKGLQYPVVIYAIPDKSMSTQRTKNKSWLNPGLPKLDKLKSFPFSLSSLKDTNLSYAYENEHNDNKLDDVNLFYVALTRAKHRLFILANKYEESKTKKNQSELYTSFTPSALLYEFLTDKEKNKVNEEQYSFGTTSRLPIQKPIVESAFYYLNQLNGSSWRKHISLADTIIDEEKEPNYSKQIWGTYVHEVLANIENVEDIDQAIDRAFYAGYFNQKESEELESLLHQIINHPTLAEFYKKGLQISNEAEIIDAFGTLLRPDRIVFFKNKTVIIDYKTGFIDEKHKKQINDYADLLAQLNYPKPENYLVYISDKIEVVRANR
jgi:ATP-dependent exoDNAse (exonuclease V) beta subunit